jgi:hypothetical protein
MSKEGQHHSGAIKLTNSEWERLNTILWKKRPDLIEKFKRSATCLDNCVILMNPGACMFYNEYCRDTGYLLKEVLNDTPPGQDHKD